MTFRREAPTVQRSNTMETKHHKYALSNVLSIFEKFRELYALPQVTINLKYSSIPEDDQFFHRITSEFFLDSTQPHPKFPLVRRKTLGYTVCRLSPIWEGYSTQIQASARRNCKKAMRLGYSFEQIDYNVHLEDISQIIRSAPIRQGKSMPKWMIAENPPCINEHISRCAQHDYPTFGIRQHGRLVAYAGCFIAGDLCEIQTIYGHARHQPDGIIPLLIVSIGNTLIRSYGNVKYYSFGTYFGSGETMRRFKRKFGFYPHRVTWELGD